MASWSAASCGNYLYDLVNQHARLLFLDNSVGGGCLLTDCDYFDGIIGSGPELGTGG
jgi:hypothetical protein